MDDYSCGCAVEGPRRCTAHRDAACHGGSEAGDECPKCRRARWLSIGSGAGTTPTRTRRLMKETRELEGMQR